MGLPSSFEDWEGDSLLYEQRNWAGLLRLRFEKAQRNTTDLYAQQRYAEALILNSRFKDALDFVSPLYRENYECGFGIIEIMDCLIALGKNENDFEWIKKPIIFKCDQDTIDFCVKSIKENGNSFVSAWDLYSNMVMKSDYVNFDEKGLADFLFKHSVTFTSRGDKGLFCDFKLSKR